MTDLFFFEWQATPSLPLPPKQTPSYVALVGLILERGPVVTALSAAQRCTQRTGGRAFGKADEFRSTPRNPETVTK